MRSRQRALMANTVHTEPAPLAAPLSSAARILIAASWLASALIFAGWISHPPWFEHIFPRHISMHPYTALMALLLASAFLARGLRQSRMRIYLALLAAFLSILRLLDAFSIPMLPDVRFETIFWANAISPTRTAIDTALSVLLLSIVAILPRRYATARQTIALFAFLSNMFVVLCFVFDAHFGRSIFIYANMALHAALVLLAISAGVLMEDSANGFMRLLTDDLSTARIIRRIAVGVPLAFTAVVFLSGRGASAGMFDAATGRAIAMTLNTGMLWTALWLIGRTSAIVEKRERDNSFLLCGIVDALDASTVICETDPQGAMLYANDRFVEMSGYSREELTGRDHRMLKTGFYPPAFFEDVRRTVMSGNVWRGETKNATKDGSLFWLDSVVAPIFDRRGNVERFIVISVPITEKKELEQRKEEFIATLSHELRDPLSSIILHAHVASASLHDRSPAQGSKDAAEAVDAIMRIAKSMSYIIGDLLDINRVARGKLRLHKRMVDLNEVVRNVLIQAASFTRRKKQEIVLETSNEPIALKADSVRLEQIMINLLSNASRYSEPMTKIWVGVQKDGHFAQVCVRDEGIGIEPAHMPGIFAMFSQATPENIQSRSKGLGIGLALVKHLVELHGGRVIARSEGKGKGSEFIVRLPLSGNAKAQRLPEEAADLMVRDR